ncbi:MAG: sugar-binding domain-containing protein [Clostridium sp.]
MSETRSIMELNGVWRFKLDEGKGFKEDWYKTKLENTIEMAVPSSYNDLIELKEIRNHIGWVWYEREFSKFIEVC